MSCKKNLFIFIADALRYDYLPESIRKSGTVLKTLAPSTWTPISLVSILTARNPENHNVRCFYEPLDPAIKTVFDFFSDGCYFDYPADPMSNIVLRRYHGLKELKDLKEPFVWVERAMETHYPYGAIRHGGIIKGGASKGVCPAKEYKIGISALEDHFWSHIGELKKLGRLENTLVILTSDHGELLGEYGSFFHCGPPIKELVEVPTLFFSERLSFGSIRSIDILPTALGILGISWRGGDGKDIRKKTPLIGKSYFPGFHSRWRFNKNNGFELSTTELEEREFGKEISNSLSFCISSTQRFWSMLTRACIYYLNKRRHREAERWFKRALLLEGVPSSSKAFAFHQLGELYLSLGDYEKAEEEFCKLFLLKGPQISWKTFLIRRLRDIYLAKGRKEELQDRFREYSLLKGVDEIFKGTVLLELGELYLSQGRHEDALRKFTECILMKNITLSLRATAYYKRGSLYEKAGFLSQARKDFQEVLCILRDDNLHQANELIGGAHFHMGRIYQRMCRLEDARREFERCLRIIPRHMKAKEALCIYANQAKITKRLRFLGYL